MGIFGELFKKNKEIEVSDVIEVSEEKVNEITPEQNKDSDVEKALKNNANYGLNRVLNYLIFNYLTNNHEILFNGGSNTSPLL